MKLEYDGQLPSKSNYRKGKDWRRKWARIKAAEKDLGLLALANGAKLTEDDVAITVVLYNQRVDADNALKVIGDGLEGVCYANDKQVKNWSVGEVKDGNGPRVLVQIEEIEVEA